VRFLAVAAAAAALAAPVPAASVQYVLGRQQVDGGFSDSGRSSNAALTAWSILALVAAGKQPTKALDAAAFLARQPAATPTNLELTTLALVALGHPVDALADRVDALLKPTGHVGESVIATAWGALAQRAARRPVADATVRWLLAQQSRQGGWPRSSGGKPVADDTAVAVESLRAAGVSRHARAIARAFAYLERVRNADGGYGAGPGDPSSAQTTAWVAQAFVAAGRDPGDATRQYLLRAVRAGGARHLWTTALVLPGLAGKPFPLYG
jgi:hypothetical protein